MSYQISDGILESELSKWLTKAGQKYGKFKDGRVNYTDADIAPVVMITVVCGNKILLAKRGHGLADAEGYWSTINGFIDEDKPVAEIAAQELKEEISLEMSPLKIKVGPSYTVKNLQEKRSYIIFPCLVKLDAKPEIVLDHEHTEFTWTKRGRLEQYHMLDDTSETIDAALRLL
ncbi:MAG: NUDIX domain-containing protein [Patescibacteria group bacterium]